MAVNSTITQKRAEKDMTMADLARAVGVTPAAVLFWERGTTAPSSENLVKLADVLGCTIDELLGREKKEA